MKKLIVCLFIAASLVSCKDNGKKIKIEGTNTELYYKDGVTEAEAKSTGDYLKNEILQDTKKAGTLQLTKKDDVYTLHLVYIKSVYDSMPNADNNFKELAAAVSKKVLNGKHVDIALSDKELNDYKVIPFDEAMAKLLDAPPAAPAAPATTDAPATGVSGYKNSHKDGTVAFYWTDDITNEEAKVIGEYIVKNGAFNGGHCEIYMSKEGDRYIIKFPMTTEALNDPSYTTQLEKVSKEIKDNVFANETYSFIATDTEMNTMKKFDY